MKSVVSMLLFLPFSLAAQSDSVSSEKLSRWYRNSYEAKNEEPTIVSSEEKEQKTNAISKQNIQGSFLYLPYSIPFFTYNQPPILRNTPYYNSAGYMNPSGANSLGQFLIAGGLNYMHYKFVKKREKK